MTHLNALLMTGVALFFFAVTLSQAKKLARLERENEVLWDQVNRYDAYVRERAAEDEMKQRAAVMN